MRVVAAVVLVALASGCVGGDSDAAGEKASSGDGWRVVAATPSGGEVDVDNGLATTDAQLAVIIAETEAGSTTGDVDGGLAVDLHREVVFRWAETHGSGCPELRFDGLEIAENRLDPVIVSPDDDSGCTDDLAGVWVFLVAVDRSVLPEPPFAVGGGSPRSSNVGMVRVDLSEPGSVAVGGDPVEG